MEEYETILGTNTSLIAISTDDMTSHKRFCENLKDAVPFPLGSDKDLAVSQLYEVLDDTNKRSRRVIFVVSSNGIIEHKIDPYQPANESQLLSIFEALGVSF